MSSRKAACFHISRCATTSRSWRSYLRRDADWIESRLNELAQLVHLPRELMTRFPAELSGGQRQRVSLMRALMLDPDLLLLDEPLGALDPMIRYRLQQELKSIFGQLGKTVVMVTHDIAEAAFFGQTLVLMRDGRIVQTAPSWNWRRPRRNRSSNSSSPHNANPWRSSRQGARMKATGWIMDGHVDRASCRLPCQAPFPPPRRRRSSRSGPRCLPNRSFSARCSATLAEAAGVEADHQQQLGGTRVLWNALVSGEIDAYPEYTGTLMQEILASENLRTRQALEQALATRGLQMTAALGFNNSYAIGVKKALAEQLALHTISDLKNQPELALGFGNEFMDRADGWPGLQQHYQLPQRNVRGLDHDLAYRGIESGTLQVTDLYSTDAEIVYYQLRALEDDLNYFPVYKRRHSLPQRTRPTCPRGRGPVQAAGRSHRCSRP